MNYKKGLCFLLVLSLVLGSFPAGVLAEDAGLQQAARTESEAVTAGDEAQAEMPKDALPMDEADGTALPDRQLETAVQETTPAADFTYQEEADGSVTITGYTGQATTIVFPADIGGKPVKKVEPDYNSRNTNVVSIVIPEGVEYIGTFSGWSSLAQVDLPSSAKTVLGFMSCALTNTDGFSKLSNLENYTLNLTYNQITDVNGLRNLSWKDGRGRIELSNNPELIDIAPLADIEQMTDLYLTETGVTNISALKGHKALEYLYVQKTNVSEEMAFDVANIHFEDIETNALNKRINALPSFCQVFYGENQSVSPEFNFWQGFSCQVENQEIIEFEKFDVGPQNGAWFNVKSVGTTNVAIHGKEGSKDVDYTFKVIVKDMEKAPDAGKPVENLPTLNIEEHFTADGVYQLNLQDDGTLYNVTGGESQPIMENVKAITTSQRTNRSQDSYTGQDYPDLLYIQDTSDSLWIQPDMTQNPVKVSDNVHQYVANNAYSIMEKSKIWLTGSSLDNYQGDSWAWILHKDGTVDWMDSTGTMERQNVQNVKDIANLSDTMFDGEWANKGDAGWYVAGMLALNDNNELWYRVRLPGTDYVKLAENVASIEPDMYFKDTGGQRHKISVAVTGDNQVTVTEAVDNALARWPNFYVTAEGTWYQPTGLYVTTPAEPIKICDAQMAEKPQLVSENRENKYYFRDTNNTLWCYNASNTAQPAEKIADNVLKFIGGSTWRGTTEVINNYYLREDHVLVNLDTGEETERVKDIAGEANEYILIKTPDLESDLDYPRYYNTFDGPYILYEDGRLFYSGAEIMSGVETINVTSDAHRKYVKAGTPSSTAVNNAYILRSDGTIWVHDLNNPTVVTKLADYTPVVSLGDIDGDGEINASDALLALRHSVREIDLKDNPPAKFPAGAFERANVTFDTEVNASDALQILRYSVKEITEFKRPEAAKA